jgi:hypothetical protein
LIYNLKYKKKEHPYVFVARTAFKELIESDDSLSKILLILPKLIPHLRNTLRSKDMDTFKSGLESLEQLSNVIGQSLNPHLLGLLSSLNQKLFDKNVGTKVQEVLQVLDENGGEQAVNIIKSKIPTYTK